MSNCPQCRQPLPVDNSECPSCAAAKTVQDAGAVTLDGTQSPNVSDQDDLQACTLDSSDASLASTFEASDGAATVVPRTEAKELLLPAGLFSVERQADVPLTDLASTILGEMNTDLDATFQIDLAALPRSQSLPPSSGDAQGTVMYSSVDMKSLQASHQQSRSAGQLQNLWAGLAGSSDNPMRSLAAEQEKANDSIFQRVALRRVVQPENHDDPNADYQILRKLGEGAMGVVYAVRQVVVDRVVALKAIKSGLQASDESRRKFFYEAQITADLDHPNIVPIHELGATEDGMLFYSMKLVSGTEWKDVIKTNSREENLEIFMNVADAVAFAHSKGVIHRDLKPENTMLGKYGEVFVTDWGLAVNLNKQRQFNMGGTPIYMAPEMAAHSLSKIGPASDIYVLGAILYQVVTGRAPHTGKNVSECLRAALNNEIVPYETEDPLLPIALKAMEKNVEDRYSSVEALQDAIKEYRRHTESNTIVQRAEEMLAEAEVRQDYELFSRTLFSFRDAIDLWAENTQAVAGLKRARLAYGQCAINKGDYDLALQTLDRSEPNEAPLVAEAEKAKHVAEGRERRFKALRKVLAAVILSSVVVASSLAGVALFQWSRAATNLQEAIKQTGIANTKTQEAIDNLDEAKRQEAIAKQKTQEASDNLVEAQKQRNDAINNLRLAKEQEALAKEQEALANAKSREASDNLVEAKKQEQLAREQERLASFQRQKAEEARQIAEMRSAQIQLGDYQSKLALAKAQIEQSDVLSGKALLETIRQITSTAFQDRTPKLDTWAWRRIRLQSNADIPKQELQGEVNGIALARQAKKGVVAFADGRLVVVHWENGRLQLGESKELTGHQLNALAMSPQGDEVLLALSSQDSSGLMVWKLDSHQEPQRMIATENRSMQGIAYSADGKQVLAGINGGLWVWDRENPNWYRTGQPKSRHEFVRGSLMAIQSLDHGQWFLWSKYADRSHLSLFDPEARAILNLEIPEAWQRSLTAAAWVDGEEELILANEDGTIWTSKRDRTKNQLGPFQELQPSPHRSAVRQLSVYEGRHLVSLGDEPVAHVWSRMPGDDWQYETYLAGTSRNLSSVGFLSSAENILGVDVMGELVAWNVPQQKQQRQLVFSRPGARGSLPAPNIPISFTFPQNSTKSLGVIDSNGIYGRMSLSSGQLLSSQGELWSYFGHTPGALFSDLAVSSESSVVVTSALLPPSPLASQYLVPEGAIHEFCVWNEKTGQMLHRFTNGLGGPRSDTTTESERVQRSEPRLTLLQEGKLLLVGDDSVTRILRLDGKPVFESDFFGAQFAAGHPVDKQILALVKRTGAVQLVNLNDRDNWSNKGLEQNSLVDSSDVPMQAKWSSDGKWFVILFASGGLGIFELQDTGLRLAWSSRALGGSEASESLGRALLESPIRVRSHHDAELELRTLASDGSLQIVLVQRRGGENPLTKEIALRWSKERGVPELVRTVEHAKLRWLDANAPETRMVGRLHDGFDIDSSQVRGRVQIGALTYLAMRSGNILRLDANQKFIQSYGRERLVDASANRDGDLVVALYDDGSIWTCKHSKEFRPVWTRASYTLRGAEKLQVSPDGTQLAIGFSATDERAAWLRTVELESGKVLDEIGDTTAFRWDIRANATLYTLNEQGEIGRLEDSKRVPIATIGRQDGLSYRSLDLFEEAWQKPEMRPVRHFLIYGEDSESGYMSFLPFSGGEVDTAPTGTTTKTKLPKGTRIATSPTEGTLVTGDERGTVSVWFATPTWDTAPRQLYDFEAHRGARIESLRFDPQGDILFSTDDKGRLFGWLSKTPSPP